MTTIDTYHADELPQLYARWRRRTLAAAILATAAGIFLHAQVIDGRYDPDEQRTSIWMVLGVLLILLCAVGSGVGGTSLTVAALSYWRRLGRSKRLARIAWMLWVLGPLPILLLPISHLLHLKGEDALKASTTMVLYLLTVTVPSLFALLPGILSGSLVLERFLPESKASGQIILLAAPSCIVVYLVPLGLVAQIAFHRELYLGLLLLAISPAIPLLAVRRLLRRNTPQMSARLVRNIGVLMGSLAAAGAILLLGWIGEHPQLQAWIGQLDPIWALGIVARVLASKWLTTVVVVDYLVSMLSQTREAGKSLAETAEGDLLGKKLDALGNAFHSAEPLLARINS